MVVSTNLQNVCRYIERSLCYGCVCVYGEEEGYDIRQRTDPQIQQAPRPRHMCILACQLLNKLPRRVRVRYLQNKCLSASLFECAHAFGRECEREKATKEEDERVSGCEKVAS